jgi:tetratricopeptide (TPR) repeat protein
MRKFESNGARLSAASVARAALDHVRNGRPTEAMRGLRDRLAASPLAAGEAAELRLVLARIELDAGQAKTSVAELVQVLEVDAHRPDALLLLTEALIACRQWHPARESLERAARAGGDPHRIRALQASLNAGNTDDAEPGATVTPKSSDDGVVLIGDPFGDELDTVRSESPPTLPMTDPVGWSFGEPGAASTSTVDPMLFDDPSTTGSFGDLGQSLLHDAHREVEAFRERHEQTTLRPVRPAELAVEIDESDLMPLNFDSQEITTHRHPGARGALGTPGASTAAPPDAGQPPQRENEPASVVSPHSQAVDRSPDHRPVIRVPAPLDDTKPAAIQPDLQAKIGLAKQRQSAKRDTVAGPPATPPAAVRAIIPATVIAAVGVAVAVIALIVWPAIHYSSVVQQIDRDAAQANIESRTDTFAGYRRASAHLQRAIEASGPGGEALDGITEAYLAALGVNDIATLRTAATARLGEVHGVLETRFGRSESPSTAALIEALTNEENHSPDLAAARVWAALGTGASQALALANEGIEEFPAAANLHYLRGTSLDALGDPALAKQSWERAAVLDPSHVPARLSLAVWHAERRNRLALKSFDDILTRLSPAHPGATVERAAYLVEAGTQLDDARRDLDGVLALPLRSLSPRGRSRAHHVSGLWLRAKGDNAGAAVAFVEALDIDPRNQLAAVARIQLLIDEDDLGTTDASLEELEHRLPARGPVRRLRALWHLRSGDPRSAEAVLGAIPPSDSAAQLLLGDILLQLGHWRRAETAYGQAEMAGNNAAHDLLNLVRAIRGDEAAVLHLQADTLKSSDAAASWRLGRARLERGELNSALTHLTRAQALDPTGSYWHRNPPAVDLCRLHYLRNDFKATARLCDDAISRRPSVDAPHRIRASLAMRQGDFTTAHRLLSQLVQRRPEDLGAQRALARSQISLGRLTEAEATVEGLLTANDPTPDLLVVQGLLEIGKRRPGFAVGYLERAISTRPKDPEAHYHLARCYLAQDKLAAALPHIRAARRARQWSVAAQVVAAQYHAKKGDWRAAVRAADNALRLAKRRPAPPSLIAEAHTSRAKALQLRYGPDNDRAVRALKRAARLDHAPAFFELAKVAKLRRDQIAYLSALQSATDRDPTFCAAVRLLREEALTNTSRELRVPKTCQ